MDVFDVAHASLDDLRRLHQSAQYFGNAAFTEALCSKFGVFPKGSTVFDAVTVVAGYIDLIGAVLGFSGADFECLAIRIELDRFFDLLAKYPRWVKDDNQVLAGARMNASMWRTLTFPRLNRCIPAWCKFHGRLYVPYRLAQIVKRDPDWFRARPFAVRALTSTQNEVPWVVNPDRISPADGEPHRMYFFDRDGSVKEIDRPLYVSTPILPEEEDSWSS